MRLSWQRITGLACPSVRPSVAERFVTRKRKCIENNNWCNVFHGRRSWCINFEFEKLKVEVRFAQCCGIARQTSVKYVSTVVVPWISDIGRFLSSYFIDMFASRQSVTWLGTMATATHGHDVISGVPLNERRQLSATTSVVEVVPVGSGGGVIGAQALQD